MKKSLFLSLLLAFSLSMSAQWVTIPDPAFANKLNELIPECMDGNQMNTECQALFLVNFLDVSYSGISDLTGIEYFVGIESIDCSNNNLTWLPNLPPSLISFACINNNISNLPPLPSNLSSLVCYNNNLTNLPSLPPSLVWLYCANNYLTVLPDLPEFLTQLDFSGNNISNVPSFTQSLGILNCSSNNITSLPELPESLMELYCNDNNISILPELPESLYYLSCISNNLIQLPSLPENLESLYCNNNNLEILPELPTLLTTLNCHNNYLTSLPELPQTLTILNCSQNNLTSLTELPPSLTSLICNNNELSCLPTLPMSLVNSSTSFGLNISNNPFTCLPNYVPAMSGATNSQWLSYPLCDLADVTNNPYGCSSFAGILGTVFNDENTDCQENPAENLVLNASLHLFDDGGNLIAQTYTFGDAEHTLYNFIAEEGTYTVEMNTDNMPFQASCIDPGTEQNVILTTPSPSALNVDFGVECLPGFDVGVQSVVTTGWVFPGQVHTLKLAAGDMSSWYGLQCAQGVGGTVTVYVDGPVSYVGPASSSLTPSVSGDLQFTYEIADFSLVNFQQDFGLLFETDTTAQAGELICVDIIINPIDNDFNPINNTYNYCYQAVNSYDPNIKTVWPGNVEPGFDDYFNYTIYFQNTGTAPAFNIRLADTLDTNLDLSTFQVTNYSHPVLTYLHGNVLTFRFNNIMLPDSTTDLEGSIGYVQYRIKPIADLLVGTVIENTAHIFFDFNDAIVTNTTVNEYVIPTSVNGLAQRGNLMLFPNPASGLFTIEWNNHNNLSTIQVFNMNGVRVLQKQSYQNHEVMDLSSYPAGVYMVRVSNSQSVMQTKLIKR